MSVHIQLRRDTAANWTAANPVLADGEVGVEKATGKVKIGDGATYWNDLPYFAGAPSGAAGGGLTGTYPNPGLSAAAIEAVGDPRYDAAGAAAAAQAASAQKASNLSDLASAATARTNLGLGSAATHAATDFDSAGAAAAEMTRAEAAEALAAQKASNLSDLASAATARTNLGLGSAATQPSSAFDAAGTSAAETTRATAAEALAAQKASNLSDLASAATARTNLGLGSAATQPSSAFDAAGTSAAETTRATAAEALALLKSDNLASVADIDTSRANLRVPVLRHAQCVATTNRALSGALPTIDGYAVQDGDRVLLTAQTTGSQNGMWLAHTTGWVRPNDYPAGGVLTSRSVKVAGGTTYGGTDWVLSSTGSVTIDTTAVTWKLATITSGQLPASVPLLGSANTFTAEQTVPDLNVAGLTGATAASRYVGATASGAPVAGTFAKGDFVIDQTGIIWICTTAGTPGTWTAVQPGVELGYAQITSNVALTTTQSDIAGLSITVTVGSRPILVVFDARSIQISATGAFNTITLMEGATVLADVQVGIGAVNGLYPAHREVRLAPSAGSHTYKIQGGSSAGGASDKLVASATSPAFIRAMQL